MVGAVRRMLHQVGVTDLEPVYVEADDCSVDDSIDLCKAGVPTTLSLQIGHGYFGANRYEYDTDGQLDSCWTLYMGEDFHEAARKLVAAAA